MPTTRCGADWQAAVHKQPVAKPLVTFSSAPYVAKDVHKVALELGPLTIHWYGVLVALAFLAGLWTASRFGLREGIPAETILDLGPWLIVGAILGARILYVISYWRESFANQPLTEIFMIHHGGLVFYGGFIGAALALLLRVRMTKLPLWKIADALAPGVALGYVLGRFGCLMNGCCYGRPTALPWAIHFPLDNPTKGVGVHPSQIYDSLLNAGLFAVLAWLYGRKKFDGQIFAVYLVCYALLRSVVELFRGDYPVHYLGGVATPAQLISVCILMVGLVLLWKLPRPRAAKA